MSAVDSNPRRCRILIVDDNADAGDSLAMLLRRSWPKVIVARDGFTACEVALTFRPHLILLDIGLPGKDGYEVAKELRGRPETRDVLLVGLSGYAQDEDQRHAEAAGFDHYFTKPVDLDELIELILRTEPSCD